MQRKILSFGILAVAVALVPAVVHTQQQTGTNPKEATYVTKEEIDTVGKQTGTDRTIRVMDIGHENFSVGIIHRGATAARGAGAGAGAAAAGAGAGGGRAGGGAGAGAAAGGGRAGGGAGGGAAAGGGRAAGGAAAAGGGGGRAAAAPAERCGDQVATPPASGGAAGMIAHDSQTEGYLIISGGGTLVTGGRIINGSKTGPDNEVTTTLNGPSCNGTAYGNDIIRKVVKTGDIIIIPSGVPHGWTDITDEVTYLSFRPSQRVLTAGYINPSIKK